MVVVYCRPHGKLESWNAATDDPLEAREAVARQWTPRNGVRSQAGSSLDINMRLSDIRWSLGPFLAVVPSNKQG